MKITDPEYVLRLWASSVRPSAKLVKPRGYERPGPGDDRASVARAIVENCPTFRTAKPVLWTWYVLESFPTDRDATIVAAFKAELREKLESHPIIVADYVVPDSDFYVTVWEAYDRLVDACTPVTRKTLQRWVAAQKVTNYKMGAKRMVKWSEVRKLAPTRKLTEEQMAQFIEKNKDCETFVYREAS